MAPTPFVCFGHGAETPCSFGFTNFGKIYGLALGLAAVFTLLQARERLLGCRNAARFVLMLGAASAVVVSLVR